MKLLPSEARRLKRRHVTNWLAMGMMVLCLAIVLLPLANILWLTIREGLPALSWSFFTSLPKPLGEVGGGMANAIVGSVIIVGMASLIGLPLGILSGVFLAELAPPRVAEVLRFAAEIMMGVPSIVIGIVVYAAVVLMMGTFSAIAGAIALALIMLPLVTRTTDTMLQQVPLTLREAGLALGLPRWRVILGVTLPAASRGILTGAMLAVARVAGETAPLLFTAFGNSFWPSSLDRPVATLPVQIFTYAISPYKEWQAQAWAGSLVLVLFILLLTTVARLAQRRAP